MGYFKNQLIANQVELGDRIPAPKPASSHVAYPTGAVFPSRRLQRKARQESVSRIKKMNRRLALDAAVYFLIGSIAGAVTTYLVVVVS